MESTELELLKRQLGREPSLCTSREKRTFQGVTEMCEHAGLRIFFDWNGTVKSLSLHAVFLRKHVALPKHRPDAQPGALRSSFHGCRDAS